MKTDFIVGVVGNPNCGKTTLFNVLTGSRQQVGNWPGVTVEKKTGEYRFGDKHIELVDLPGTYSLESADDSVSLDEKVARDYVASRTADLIINIVDASNIERN
ncbi:MAG: FeoB small GTPase domain-containing protein, partial [Methylococcales bacterium]|nr:FeoB small GTPase domain-containing protein [Methylococcales bacterium]